MDGEKIGVIGLIDFSDSVEVHNTEDGREVERSMKKEK